MSSFHRPVLTKMYAGQTRDHVFLFSADYADVKLLFLFYLSALICGYLRMTRSSMENKEVM